MKHFLSRLPRTGLLVAGVVTAIFGVAATAHAYYPERPTYTVANPADHVTFNSITDNPREGDERAFFTLKDNSNTAAGGFAHNVTVHDGETVLLRLYVHNNAASDLNGANLDGTGVAKNTQVRVWLPSVSDSTMRANAYVSADNATPQTVSDSSDLTSGNSSKFTLQYVPGSAVAYNNFAGTSGLKLNDSIVTTGAKIGEAKADGIVPGCFDYVNVVTLQVKVHMATTPVPGFTVSKKVQLNGGAWSENVTAKPGDTVKYRISFKNTGSTTLNNVVLHDTLPAGETVVPGTSKLVNSNNPNGVAANDNIATSGVNIGSYGPGANAYLDFEVKLPAVTDLQTCGATTLINTAEATVNGQKQSDTASVTMNKACATIPPVLPNTGAGNVIGLFAGVTALAAVVHRLFLSRRLAR